MNEDLSEVKAGEVMSGGEDQGFTRADGGVMAMVRQRWFGIGVCVLGMAVGALTFSLGFAQSGPGRSAEVMRVIFQGPFGVRGLFPWFGSAVWSVFPWAAVVLLVSHPLRPRGATLVTTCMGGALWWLMGWYGIAAR